MSDNKRPTALDQIRRARNISTCGFTAVTAGVIVCVVLRELDHITPGIYGLVLTLWVLAGLAAVGLWCTVYVCEWDARNVRRAEQIGRKVDQLREVGMVAEWMAVMEDDRQRSDGN